MNRIKHYRVAAWLTSLSLMVSMCCGILVTDRASAQSAPAVPPGVNQPVRTSQATYPELTHYATDLTALAHEGRLDPVHRRPGLGAGGRGDPRAGERGIAAQSAERRTLRQHGAHDEPRGNDADRPRHPRVLTRAVDQRGHLNTGGSPWGHWPDL